MFSEIVCSTTRYLYIRAIIDLRGDPAMESGLKKHHISEVGTFSKVDMFSAPNWEKFKRLLLPDSNT